MQLISTQFHFDSDKILKFIGYPTIISSLESDWPDIDQNFINFQGKSHKKGGGGGGGAGHDYVILLSGGGLGLDYG